MNADILPIAEAEKLAGKRLDRRRKYFLHEGKVSYWSYHTTECSGCFEGGDYMGLAHNYPYDDKAKCYIGSGCEECGYTGKRRFYFPVPHDAPTECD